MADTQERRAEIARRLKAARWLAGDIDLTGKKPKVSAITPDDLAERDPLPDNGITASLIGSIERMERRALPMGLQALAAALGLPAAYFTSTQAVGHDPAARVELLTERLERVARDLAPEPPAEPPDPDDPDQ